MQRVLIILLIIFASLSAGADTITATMKTKKSAELSSTGQLPAQMSVSYSNSGPTTTQVTQGSKATLCLSGWPEGTIQSITLWMSSNSKAGSATVTIEVADSSWEVASGIYRDWPGIKTYSTDSLPISGLAHPIAVPANAKVQVQIVGLINSVYLSKVEIEYTESPKQPHTVTLNYLDTSRSWQSTQLVEDSATAGVLLPLLDTTPIYFEDKEWYSIGWCEQPSSTTNDEPLHWEAGDWYGPSEDCNLYALYTNKKSQKLVQDTSLQSGEYLMVRRYFDFAWVLTGAWKNGKIDMYPITMHKKADGLYELPIEVVNDTCRYQLQFTKDSVYIRHVVTKSRIGYSKNATSRSSATWAWKKAAEGTIFIHNTWKETPGFGPVASYWGGMSLIFDGDTTSLSGTISYAFNSYEESSSYWYLFSTKDVPMQQDIYYTTFDTYSAIVDTIVNPVQKQSKAYLLRKANGSIIIINNQQQYDLIGRIL